MTASTSVSSIGLVSRVSLLLKLDSTYILSDFFLPCCPWMTTFLRLPNLFFVATNACHHLSTITPHTTGRPLRVCVRFVTYHYHTSSSTARWL
jgi:hypothetical protein